MTLAKILEQYFRRHDNKMKVVLHEQFMEQALHLAKISARLGEVPVGAIAVLNDEVIGQGFNRRELINSCLEHAEIKAIKEASARLSNWRLEGVTLYSTLEPCIMCAGALLHARVKKLIYGAADAKFGAIESLFSLVQDNRLNHQIEVVSGVMAEESKQLLREFFLQVRARKPG
jgi:tRNA(adenine34) deaminase